MGTPKFGRVSARDARRPRLPAFGLALALIQSLWAAPATLTVRQYGAVGDGTTLDTAAFNAAIAACAEARCGQILVPPGRYLTGTIRLKSNLTLLLDAGAEIVGTPDLDRYEAFTGQKDNPLGEIAARWHRALVLGVDVENVTITGRGTINGNKVFDAQGEEHMRGPHAVLFGNSRNITLRDISIRDAGNYAVMLEFTSDVSVRGVTVTGGWDGVHFRGWEGRPCRNVSITDSEFYTGDDSIAGWFWEDTLIARCILNSSCNGIRLIGPATRLIIHDCLFFGPGRFEHRTSRERHRTNMLAGILLQPGAWDPTRGRLDDIRISDITLHDVATPFSLTLTPGNTAGTIAVNRMTATGIYRAAASLESWAEEAVDKVTLRDLNLEFQGGGSAVQAQPAVQRPAHDARTLPVWGLYARNVKSLELQNVRLNLASPDGRSAFMADDLDRLELDSFRFPQGAPRRDTDVKTVAGECVRLEAGGDPFAATATIENHADAGLARVQLSLDGRPRTRWIFLRAGERQEVVFSGWKTPAPGTHTVQCGALHKQLQTPESR